MVEDCHEYFVNDILVHNCIGWLLSYWLMTSGKNLSYYGIDSRRIMGQTSFKSFESPEELAVKYQQAQLRDDIERIYQELSKSQDEFVSRKLEHELARLDKQVILEEGEIYSLDGLIQSAREARVGKKRNIVSRLQGYQSNQPLIHQYSGMLTDRPISQSEYHSRC